MHNSRIICAANRIALSNATTILLVGPRHWDKTMHNSFDNMNPYDYQIEFEVQGFIDQFGNFYDRYDAWIIAETNGQIIRRVGGDTTLDGKGRLFSENLY